MAPRRARDITPRQLAVIRACLAAGGPKRAAKALGISPLTVRGHLVNARLRMDVETTEQLVYVLVRRGCLTVPELRGAVQSNR